MKLHRCLVALILLATLLWCIQPIPAQAAAPAALPNGLLRPDGSLDLSRGFNVSLDLRGWRVSLDPRLGPLMTASTNPGWNLLGTWSPTGSSVVYALTVYGSDVYVGGEFHSAGGVQYADHIAKWNPTAGWSAIGRGTDETVHPGTVRAIAVSSTYVYAGGDFMFALNSNGNWAGGAYVARWDVNLKNWSSLGTGCCDIGTSGPVYALALSGDSLYLGGNFSGVQNGFLPCPYILRWDTSANSWNKVGQGLNNAVYALAASGSDLYVGGAFTQATDTGGATLATSRLARWDGSAWNAVGKGTNGTVSALAASGSDLYVGGAFTQATNTDNSTLTANRLARWSAASGWSSIGKGVNGAVNALLVSGSDLYVGGAFTQATNPDDSTVAANYVAKWDGATWSTPGKGVKPAAVQALAMGADGILVGGAFSSGSNQYGVSGVSLDAPLPANPSNDNTPDFTFSALADVALGGLGVYVPTETSQTPYFSYHLDSDAWSADQTLASASFTTPLADGEHTFWVKAFGTDWTEPVAYTWTIDTLRPDVALSTAVASPTHTSPIPVTVTFSEPVTGFTAGDIATTNATAGAVTGSGASYQFNLTPASDGPVTAQIAADSATDPAGNGSTLSNTLSLTYDTTSPAVTLVGFDPHPTTSAGAALTWHAAENGSYSVRVGGTDCASGTQVESGTYATSPADAVSSISAADLAYGPNAVRVCVTDAAANTGSAGDILTKTAITATALTIDPDPMHFSAVYTLTAVVAASDIAAGIPTGSISFYDGGTLLVTRPLDAQGKASLVLSAPAVGLHTFHAVYSGDVLYVASQQVLPVVVPQRFSLPMILS